MEKLKEYRHRVKHGLPPVCKSTKATTDDELSQGSGDGTEEASPSSSTISALDKILTDDELSPSERGSTLTGPSEMSPFHSACSPWGTGEEHQRVRTAESVDDDRWTPRPSSPSSIASDSSTGTFIVPVEFKDNPVRRRYLSETARESRADATDEEEDEDSEEESEEESEEDSEEHDSEEESEEHESSGGSQEQDKPNQRAKQAGGREPDSWVPSKADLASLRRSIGR
jgi:hypothetical protein